MSVIIGKILEGEKTVRFNLDIHCSNCGKQVPGGMKTGEKSYQSKAFSHDLEEFLKNYLCGICRDKKRQNR